MWDAATGAKISELAGGTDKVSQIAVNEDASLVLTGSGDGIARLWNTRQPKDPQKQFPTGSPISSIALSSDAKFVATGSDDGYAHVWDVASGKELPGPKKHTGRVTSIAFHPSGDYLIAGSGTSAKIWDLATQKLKGPPLTGHSGSVLSIAVSHQGDLLATGGRDNKIVIWRLPGGEKLKDLEGHTDAVTSLAFGEGGKLVSASTDGTYRVWDVATGLEIAAVNPDLKALSRVALSSKGRRIIVGSSDGRVLSSKIFFKTAELVQAAELEVARCLTPEQMTTFHVVAVPKWCLGQVAPAKWPYGKYE